MPILRIARSIRMMHGRTEICFSRCPDPLLAPPCLFPVPLRAAHPFFPLVALSPLASPLVQHLPPLHHTFPIRCWLFSLALACLLAPLLILPLALPLPPIIRLYFASLFFPPLASSVSLTWPPSGPARQQCRSSGEGTPPPPLGNVNNGQAWHYPGRPAGEVLDVGLWCTPI